MPSGNVRLTVSRPTFAGVVPVVADGPRAPLHLSDNTNLFGTPPGVLEGIRRAEASDVVHYPPSSGPQLREAIASYLGVQPNEIVLGCGADDIIDCALRAFCEPGDAIAFPDPTFVMARYFALTNSLRPHPIPVRAGGATDTNSLIAARASAVYVCAPNNPTGLQPTAAELYAVLEDSAGLVLIDEAYAEFAGESLASVAPRLDRALVIRTFSKAFGLAGLRVGYGVGAPSLVREIEKARGPFAVSGVALRAAQLVITEGLQWVQARVQDAITSREELVRLLRERGFVPLPSAANFVLVPVVDAQRAAQRLAQRGIGVRAFKQLVGIGDALRITVAPVAVMQRVADAVAELAR